MKCSFLNQNRCYRTASLIQLCLNDQTSCITVWICFQFHHFCSQKDHFQKIVDTILSMCRNRTENRTSTPVFRNQFVFGKLLLYFFNVCTRLINLVDSNDDFYTGSLCMVDCLDGLWHNTIICSDNQDCNIGRICTTHTHCGKCLMTRSIQERDLLSIDGHHRCTDMLGNTTGLAVCHTCGTDRVQQGCFTMIDMTHNTDNRWTWNQILRIFFILF